MSNSKARYAFAFMSDIQKLANEKHINVAYFKTSERRSRKGYYDFLQVGFIVPRPDKDVKNVETTEEITTTSDEPTELEKDEVNNHEI